MKHKETKHLLSTEANKERLLENVKQSDFYLYFDKELRDAFLLGAKWQEQRMYSEEEVIKLIFKFTSDFDLKKNIEITSQEQQKWFEQFKKK